MIYSKILKQTNETDFEGERLIFAETTEGHFTIENRDYEKLGCLEKTRCGRFMHWCLFLEDFCYLSPGCMDEVREMMRILGGRKNAKK